MNTFPAHNDAQSVREQKNALRKRFKLLRSELDTELKKELDRRICEGFINLASFRYAKTILMYAPSKGEINIMPIAEQALRCGKRIAFPVCNTTDHTMEFKYVTSLDELVCGEYSILTPPDGAETITDFSDSICIVPGLVFDYAGYRVGYGKGYYDRFLGSYNGSKLGLVYSDFILECVPRGRYDRHVDIILSERGVKIANTEKHTKAK